MSGWSCCWTRRDGGDGFPDGPLVTDDGGLGSCILAFGYSVAAVDSVAKVGLGPKGQGRGMKKVVARCRVSNVYVSMD